VLEFPPGGTSSRSPVWLGLTPVWSLKLLADLIEANVRQVAGASAPETTLVYPVAKSLMRPIGMRGASPPAPLLTRRKGCGSFGSLNTHHKLYPGRLLTGDYSCAGFPISNT
jgi:hypothetical protein